MFYSCKLIVSLSILAVKLTFDSIVNIRHDTSVVKCCAQIVRAAL